MSSFLKNACKKYSEKIYDLFGKHSGKMLLATSIIGTTASSLAQMGVIFFDDKYSKAQKVFMLSQELAECILSAGALFALIKPVQIITLKALKSGKILSKELVNYLKKYDMIQKRGQIDFNIKNSIEDIISKIEKSDNYLKASEYTKQALLSEHKTSLHNYKRIEDSTMALATTGATAFSTAVIIPIGRNKIASYSQKKNYQYQNTRKAPLKPFLNNETLKL